MEEIKIVKNNLPVTSLNPQINQSGEGSVAVGHLDKFEVNRYENNNEYSIAQLDYDAQYYNLLITNLSKINTNDEIILNEFDFYNFTDKSLHPLFFNNTETAKNMIYSFPTLLLSPIDIYSNKSFKVGTCQIYSIQETSGVYKILYQDFIPKEYNLIKTNIEKLNLIIKKRNSELNYPHFAIKEGNLNNILGGIFNE